MIEHELAVGCQNCQVDHTGVTIVLSFAAFFGVLALLNELIDIWRSRR